MLNAGGLAIVPTDTVYGVAASLDRSAAVDQIYPAKGRPESKPIPVLVDDSNSARRLIRETNCVAERLMETFWPGALTIVFHARPGLPAACLGNGSTVGIRMPDHDALRALMSMCGGGLAVTSANRSGEPETSSIAEALDALGTAVDIVLDGGTLTGGRPSTVIDVSGKEPKILRHGALEVDEVFAATSER